MQKLPGKNTYTPMDVPQVHSTCGLSLNKEVTLGVDSGYESIGLSAITEKKEVYSVKIFLRTDIVKLNSERMQQRKTWYRKPRFLNRRKPDGLVSTFNSTQAGQPH